MQMTKTLGKNQEMKEIAPFTITSKKKGIPLIDEGLV